MTVQLKESNTAFIRQQWIFVSGQKCLFRRSRELIAQFIRTLKGLSLFNHLDHWVFYLKTLFFFPYESGENLLSHQ